ncbi:hypothetical protein NLM27_13765 [Bradyrhizobium sp. CCGB12]|uniref:hypothetical protein n=1 Tax=Bradyrhizobium sp. CCGB12 TaxID=2949632 RepID=UPI0020B20D57|nr:hypothetical protein [Bradyrhizobium sp. CCGB12]MCP3389841.1 hypothetical protein [Bradyrhizobium sp. CCGB12]
MPDVIEHIMRTYCMMTSLTEERAHKARESLVRHLAGFEGTEREIAMEGIRFLREPRPARLRRS